MIRITQAPIAAVAIGPTCPLNPSSSLPVTWQVSGVTTATYSIEGTTDNILDSTITPVWTALPSAAGLTANQINFYLGPLQAIRLNVTAWTAGNIVLKVIQGDPAA